MDFIDNYLADFRKTHPSIEKVCKTKLPHFNEKLRNSYDAFVTATGFGNFITDEDICILKVLEKQEKYNVLYRINKDLIETFSNFPDKRIPFEAFKRLPYPAFAVKTGSVKTTLHIDEKSFDQTIPVDGFVVYCEGDKLSIVYCGGANVVITFNLNRVDMTFEDAYKFLCVKAYKQHKGLHKDDKLDKAMACISAGLITIALQVITYLVCTNADIKEVKTHREHHKSSKSYVVGEQVSHFLRTKYIGSVHHIGEGSVKRPHMRAGHFHHYYVGKGRTETIVKWVEPTFIHGGANTIVEV